MAAKKDKMIPSEKERKRALKYATPAGTGRMWVTMGIRHQVHQEGYVAGTQFRRYNSGHHCGCHERCSRYLYREVHGRVLFGVHQQ